MSFDQEKTHFGKKVVDKTVKNSLVKQVFDNVAGKYDLMNDVMSFKIHHLWKKKLQKYMPNLNGALLDMACGTGDIARSYFESAKNKGRSPIITLCDINYNMLSEGRNNSIDKGIIEGLNYVCANAEELPFKEHSFDYYTIGFGIRNVTNIDKALKEAYRVLKPGGRFICLEFSHVKNHFISQIYDFYSYKLIPQIGQFIANDKEAYQYLVESIRKFPIQEDFKNMIEIAGFKTVKYENLTFGVSAIHSGFKI